VRVEEKRAGEGRRGPGILERRPSNSLVLVERKRGSKKRKTEVDSHLT